MIARLPRLASVTTVTRLRARRRSFAGITAALACALTAGVNACGSVSDKASGEPTSPPGASPDAGLTRDAGGGSSPPTSIDVDGLLLVHAAAFPPFRICFDGARSALPLPSDLMPSSNLPGVDVGAAVRVDAPKQTLGRAFVFKEETIRSLYFGTPTAGPKCGDLLTGALSGAGVEVAASLGDLSRGFHLLVLRGAEGSLRLEAITVTAFSRPSPAALPVQLVQLSNDLDALASTRELGLAVGSLDGGAPLPLFEGTFEAGAPAPSVPVSFDLGDDAGASYAESGLFMTLGRALTDGGALDGGALPDAGDAGAREIVLAQSFADIQDRSAPRSVPAAWFGARSSYLVLTIGDRDPKLPDGGEADPRLRLHMLAMPMESRDAGRD